MLPRRRANVGRNEQHLSRRYSGGHFANRCIVHSNHVAGETLSPNQQDQEAPQTRVSSKGEL